MSKKNGSTKSRLVPIWTAHIGAVSNNDNDFTTLPGYNRVAVSQKAMRKQAPALPVGKQIERKVTAQQVVMNVKRHIDMDPRLFPSEDRRKPTLLSMK